MSTTRNKRHTAGVILDTAAKDATAAKARTSVKSFSRSVVSSAAFYESLSLSQKKTSKGTDAHTNRLIDPFMTDYTYQDPELSAIEPLYPFDKLMSLYLESALIRPCVDAYVVNIESYGYELEYIGERKDAGSAEVEAERVRLTNALSRMFCYETLRELRERSRVDYEVLGSRAFEIVRDEETNAVSSVNLIPFASVRATRYDSNTVMVTTRVPDTSSSTGYIELTTPKNFRRYIQKTNIDGRRVYFKEFGDTRRMSASTGRFEDSNYKVTNDDLATELLVDLQYVPGSVYGVPRWVGQITAVLGSREAELVNYEFFKDNAIPALAVLVSGGALTEDAIDQIEAHFTASRGRKSLNRVLVIEALADDASGGSTDHSVAAPKLEMKPMISERQQDGLFQEYDEKNALKVRSAFRLSAIYTGRTDEYNRASAYASMQVAENQIFVPERMRFDAIMNEKILSTHGLKYVRFKSLGAPLSDPESLSRILRALNDTGALTPNTIIKIANQVLNIDVSDIQEDWGNVPFDVIMGFVRQGIIPTGFENYVSELNSTLGLIGNAPTEGSRAPATAEEVKKLVQTILEDMNLQTFAE